MRGDQDSALETISTASGPLSVTAEPLGRGIGQFLAERAAIPPSGSTFRRADRTLPVDSLAKEVYQFVWKVSELTVFRTGGSFL